MKTATILKFPAAGPMISFRSGRPPIGYHRADPYIRRLFDSLTSGWSHTQAFVGMQYDDKTCTSATLYCSLRKCREYNLPDYDFDNETVYEEEIDDGIVMFNVEMVP